LCELTGYAKTALLVRSFQAITHPDGLDADLAYVEDVLAGRLYAAKRDGKGHARVASIERNADDRTTRLAAGIGA
jgi:hypothetical protein